LQGISGLSPEEVSTRFLEYAQKAIELDEALGSDHHQLAMIKLFGEWDWSGAEEELKRAMELTPNSSAAYDSYCQFLWAMGRTEESVAAGERAVEFDPLSHFANCDLAWAYYYDHRHDEATEQVQKTTELFGPACPYHSELGIRLTIEQTAIGEGEYEGLIAELERRIVAMPENRVRTVALLVYVYAKSGQHEQALEIVRTLREQATEEFVDPSHLASVHAALGDKDGALRLLEQAYQRRSFVLLNTIKIDPLYDPLREDPRFQDVLRRMGLDTGFSDR
jgi:serine/threonine-protein kinase